MVVMDACVRQNPNMVISSIIIDDDDDEIE